MLLDGAIKFANQALTGIEDTDHEMIYLGFTQCRDIVLELLNTIKTEPAPEVARSMRELYTFLYGELVRASTDSDADRVREVIKLLEYDRETWILTMEQLVKDREAGIAPVAPARASAHQPISFQA